MNRIEALDSIISRFDLNTHPFYLAWAAGTLPRQALVDYSGEYRHFIATIADGWDAIGQTAYADDERDHERMWANFQSSLGFETALILKSTEDLVEAATLAFSSPASAVGGLYAFEAQQPRTSRSKLDGLRAYYGVGAVGEEYFVVHADDVHEIEELRKHVLELSEDEFEMTSTACENVCSAMWRALDGLYPVCA